MVVKLQFEQGTTKMGKLTAPPWQRSSQKGIVSSATVGGDTTQRKKEEKNKHADQWEKKTHLQRAFSIDWPFVAQTRTKDGGGIKNKGSEGGNEEMVIASENLTNKSTTTRRKRKEDFFFPLYFFLKRGISGGSPSTVAFLIDLRLPSTTPPPVLHLPTNNAHLHSFQSVGCVLLVIIHKNNGEVFFNGGRVGCAAWRWGRTRGHGHRRLDAWRRRVIYVCSCILAMHCWRRPLTFVELAMFLERTGRRGCTCDEGSPLMHRHRLLPTVHAICYPRCCCCTTAVRFRIGLPVGLDHVGFRERRCCMVSNYGLEGAHGASGRGRDVRRKVIAVQVVRSNALSPASGSSWLR